MATPLYCLIISLKPLIQAWCIQLDHFQHQRASKYSFILKTAHPNAMPWIHYALRPNLFQQTQQTRELISARNT